MFSKLVKKHLVTTVLAEFSRIPSDPRIDFGNSPGHDIRVRPKVLLFSFAVGQVVPMNICELRSRGHSNVGDLAAVAFSIPSIYLVPLVRASRYSCDLDVLPKRHAHLRFQCYCLHIPASALPTHLNVQLAPNGIPCCELSPKTNDDSGGSSQMRD